MYQNNYRPYPIKRPNNGDRCIGQAVHAEDKRINRRTQGAENVWKRRGKARL